MELPTQLREGLRWRMDAHEWAIKAQAGEPHRFSALGFIFPVRVIVDDATNQAPQCQMLTA